MSAGIQLRVEPFGFEHAEAVINQIIRRAGNLRGPLEVAGKYLVTRAHESFEKQQSPEGEPWPALSPVTLALRDAKGGLKRARRREAERAGGLSGFSGDKELFVTGRLFGSITYSAGELELAVGTNAKFPGGDKSRAAIHQLGGKAGRNDSVTIPARPFLGVTEADSERIGKEFQDYLEKL
jgi:phage gpG-like protein